MENHENHIDKPFVFQLFLHLRKAGYSLGIPDYKDVLRAIQGGFGVGYKRELLELCKKLWMTHQDDNYEFEIFFEEAWVKWKSIKQEYLEKDQESESEYQDLGTKSSKEEIKIDTLKDSLDEKKDEPQIEKKETSLKNKNIDQSLPSAFLPGRMGGLEISDEIPLFIGSISVEREYLPFRRRQLQQQWKQLRRTQRVGIPTEVDIPATVKKIAKEHFYLSPTLRALRRNTIRLIILLDHGGSMVAFHRHGEEIKKTALSGGYFKSVENYYFYNVPGEFLYKNPSHTEFKSINQVFVPELGNRTLLVIFSDGGASRDHVRLERIEATEQFIAKIKNCVRHFVWINPLPKNRWWETSAENIMDKIPGQAMFQTNDSGIKKAIQFLKGTSRQ